MNQPTQVWTHFLDRCLDKRVRAEQFENFAGQLSKQSPIMDRQLADILIGRQTLLKTMVDPLLPVYADCLLGSNRLSSSDLLVALFKRSRYYLPRKPSKNALESEGKELPSPAELEYTILDQLTRSYIPGGTRPRTQKETRVALYILSEWLHAVAISGDGLLQSLDQQSILVYDSLGMLTIAMLENPKVIGIIDTALPKETCKSLSRSLSTFIPHWAQTSPQHVQSSTRLEVAWKHRSILDGDPSPPQEGSIDVASALQLEAVLDLPFIQTRPSVFVFINSLLASCPLTDESMMINYLHVKSNGDIQSMTGDLIIAGFDVLSCAVSRNESSETMFCLKSFLINKIPTLLTALAALMFDPLSPEFCISNALQHVDLNIFPSFGLGMISDSALQDVRQEFIYACTLHGLLPTESVERLLGETPFTPPPTPESRYHKDILVQQCATQPGRAVQLIEELEKLDGNARAIIVAVVEVIRDACTTKDTMALKSMCNALSKKPRFLDVTLQFTSPISILQPLCQFLDAWRYEDDQGEFQPVYDEFSSIFLLVLAFVYRYNFGCTDLGITTDSFVAKYLRYGHTSAVIEELDDEQSKQLGSWTKGLFGSDGITEEVTSSCRPQQFYFLVPTLFNQTLLACSEGHLTRESVKNGLEYLLEPFLLSSLVGAILWIGTYSVENPNSDLDVILWMLERLTRAPSSGDAQTMHGTVMAIIAQPLSNRLKTLRKSHPGRQDIDPILAKMKPHLEFCHGPYSACSELQAWRKSPGSLRQSVRSTFQSLITWSGLSALNSTEPPPHYNPRHFILVEREIGAKAILWILLDELKAQTEAPDGAAAVAIDIATAIVCAPTTENSPIEVGWINSPVPATTPRQVRRLNLRDVLQIEFENAADLMRKEPLVAETVIRLHRRVESQTALSTAPIPELTTSIPTMLPGLGTTANTAAVNAVAQVMVFSEAATGLDLTNVANSMALDSTLDSMNLLANQAVAGNDAADDIFGDLDLGDMMDADDDMDLDMDNGWDMS